MLIINVDHLDFVESKEDLGEVIEKVDAKVNGLFQ
jgi:deoxyadenosine/deoxycytidine kinase